jgi:protein-L-isoaspartate O-methyltransferase
MTCNDYCASISALAQALSEYANNDLERRPLNEIIQLLDAIEIIAQNNEINFESARRILDTEQLREALKVIRAFYVLVGRRLEVQNARDILAADHPWRAVNAFHYYDRYVTLVGNEVRLAAFSAGDRVVFIGGGSVPLTPMLLSTCYAIDSISIELVPQITELSKRVLDKLWYGSEIEVVCGDECALAELQYDGVIVGASAEPKHRVFANVYNAVSPATKILYRTYSGMRSLLYPPVTAKDLAGFQEVARVLPAGKMNNTSVLITKGESIPDL